jgi:hypothetical protein
MAKATDKPAVLEVKESFTTVVDGEEVTFREGEPIEAEHPAVGKWPEHFRPLTFHHPIRPALSAPEIRS